MPQNFYDLASVKKTLGETGDSLNDRIREAGELADGDINDALFNIEDVLPLPTIPEPLQRVANFLSIGYFYFLENGDAKALEIGTEKLKTYIRENYGKPKFRVRGPF